MYRYLPDGARLTHREEYNTSRISDKRSMWSLIELSAMRYDMIECKVMQCETTEERKGSKSVDVICTVK